jgi:hypothetical protein
MKFTDGFKRFTTADLPDIEQIRKRLPKYIKNRTIINAIGGGIVGGATGAALPAGKPLTEAQRKHNERTTKQFNSLPFLQKIDRSIQKKYKESLHDDPTPKRAVRGLLLAELGAIAGAGYGLHNVTKNVNKYDTLYRKAQEAARNGTHLSPILSRLKGEGIKDAKQFAKKYHPDINPNTPEDVKKHFGPLHAAIKNNWSGGVDPHEYVLAAKKISDKWMRGY